jgi:hypothetical protein
MRRVDATSVKAAENSTNEPTATSHPRLSDGILVR